MPEPKDPQKLDPKILEAVNARYEVFWARIVKKFNVSLAPLLNWGPMGIFPIMNAIASNPEDIKRANEVLRKFDENKKKVPELVGLGKP